MSNLVLSIFFACLVGITITSYTALTWYFKSKKQHSNDAYYREVMEIVTEMEAKTARKNQMSEEEYWKRVHENRKKISPNYVPAEHATKHEPTTSHNRYYNVNTEEYWHLEKEVTPVKEKKYGTIIKN